MSSTTPKRITLPHSKSTLELASKRSRSASLTPPPIPPQKSALMRPSSPPFKSTSSKLSRKPYLSDQNVYVIFAERAIRISHFALQKSPSSAGISALFQPPITSYVLSTSKLITSSNSEAFRQPYALMKQSTFTPPIRPLSPRSSFVEECFAAEPLSSRTY